MPATSRPDWAVQVAFNADPNDPTAVPDWEDQTVKVRTAGAITRGRQYELDESQAAQPSLLFWDPDEDLNPANTASPYYPDIEPYREILWQGVWPNDGTGNLINSGAWHGNNIDPYDPGFETYSNGDPIPNWLTAVGSVAATITTTNPQQGTKSVTYTVAGTATVQGLSWDVPCVPGRQYTTSGYVRQSSASTQRIELVGGSNGTSTTTTGSYVRLSVTFTATQPTHTVRLVTVGTAVAGTVNQDALQHEHAAAASTWVDTGAVIYPVMRNYVERWPRAWQNGGFAGECEAPCVDGFAALNAITLRPDYVDAVTVLEPLYYWRLNDGSDTGAFLESSGNGGPPLVQVISKYGAGTAPVPESQIVIAGDAGATGVSFTASASGSFDKEIGTCLGAGQSTNSGGNIPMPPVIGTSWAITVAAWVNLGSTPAPSGVEVIYQALTINSAGVLSRAFDMQDDNVYYQSRTFSANAFGFDTVADGQPHLLVGVISQDTTNTALTAYTDNVSSGTNTVSTAALGGMLAGQAFTTSVGGAFSFVGFAGMCNGTVAHVAVWDRALTTDEVSSLWTAGGLGNAGETPGERTARNLARSGYTGATRITTASATTMQPATWTGSIDLLTDTQDNARVEAGTVWVAPDGATVFEGRADRFVRLTSRYTFGEDTVGGEYPYQGDIVFDYDPNFVYANVVASRNNGATAIGGKTADIAAAARAYFPRSSPDLSGDMETDAQAQDLADWTFYTHRAPLQRISAITLDPASNPDLWPVVLSIEIGNRVTVVRRPSAANGGAGLVMSADYFVESVSHDEIDMETGTWTTTLLLSPIGEAPGVTVQPWILGDSTLSVLGQTTVLGF